MVKAKKTQSVKLRPPIVSVLGHVDHGKTTLLDALRKTSVASREAGGITQTIGASMVATSAGGKITFIDTPGHAAFSKMRSRGTSASDIAILAVAADDGVKPQTIESLKYIKEAKIPYIVALTKTDLASASAEKVKGQLEKEGILFEGRGGDVPLVSVSAKAGTGLNDLLEIILLLAEVNEVKGDPKDPLEAVVIETSKGKQGSVVSVVVKDGTLKVAEIVSADEISTKVRGLFNHLGRPVKEILPGEPGQILGFSSLPSVGSRLKSEVEITLSEEKIGSSRIEDTEGGLPILIKAKSSGALEAVLGSIPKGIFVLGSGVGDINESDIFLAKSGQTSKIFAYGVKVSANVLRLAQTEDIKIESFEIIYELLERLAVLLKKEEKEIFGKAEIIASFPLDDKRVAGCKVIEGRIARGDSLVLSRGETETGKVKAVSMKKMKKEINKAELGEEFGILLEPQLDFQKGDMLVSVRK